MCVCACVCCAAFGGGGRGRVRCSRTVSWGYMYTFSRPVPAVITMWEHVLGEVRPPVFRVGICVSARACPLAWRRPAAHHHARAHVQAWCALLTRVDVLAYPQVMRGGWDSTQTAYWIEQAAANITVQPIGKAFVKRSGGDYAAVELSRLTRILGHTEWRPVLDLRDGFVSWHHLSPCAKVENDGVSGFPFGAGFRDRAGCGQDGLWAWVSETAFGIDPCARECGCWHTRRASLPSLCKSLVVC
jgi:hypothetical protein